jgi:Spy/CpxP family protein refolding chaperone
LPDFWYSHLKFFRQRALWIFKAADCGGFFRSRELLRPSYWRYSGQPKLNLKHLAAPLPFRELTRSLNLGPEQCQIARGLPPEHQQRMDELRLGLAQKRQELFEIIQAGEPSWSALQDKIREISDLQGKVEVETVQFFLKFRNCLNPEQKIAFMKFMEHHLLPGQGGKGQAHGPGGPRGRSRVGGID